MNTYAPKYVIGISGGSGSGKTCLCNTLKDLIQCPVTILGQDNYYRDLSKLTLEERNQINFDHPQAIEFELMVEHLKQLQANQPIKVPVYDFTQHNRNGYQQTNSAQVIIVEGILIFCCEPLRKLFNLSIYIDVPEDLLVIRRLKRDLNERGRTFEYFEQQYYTQTRPAYFEFVKPFQARSDLVLDGTKPTMDMAQNVLEKLRLNSNIVF